MNEYETARNGDGCLLKFDERKNKRRICITFAIHICFRSFVRGSLFRRAFCVYSMQVLVIVQMNCRSVGRSVHRNGVYKFRLIEMNVCTYLLYYISIIIGSYVIGNANAWKLFYVKRTQAYARVHATST